MGKTKLIKLSVEKTKQYINNPGPKWPWFPFLPMKRKVEGKTQCGLIWAVGSQLMIYHCNLFMIPEKVVDFVKLAKWKYKSVQLMIEDGWLVD